MNWIYFCIGYSIGVASMAIAVCVGQRFREQRRSEIFEMIWEYLADEARRNERARELLDEIEKEGE